MRTKIIFFLILVAVVPAVARSADTVVPHKEPRQESSIVFHDVRSQTREFIGYYHSILLNPEQQKLKERVLSGIPAPCCAEYSILTCCCPCNLAKSIWGLSHYAIAKLHYSEEQLKVVVLEWLRFVNPKGFTGNACYRDRCGKSFSANGCGGMDEGRVIF